MGYSLQGSTLSGTLSLPRLQDQGLEQLESKYDQVAAVSIYVAPLAGCSWHFRESRTRVVGGHVKGLCLTQAGSLRAAPRLCAKLR